MIESIRYTSDGVEIIFHDDVTEWEKEAVYEYGVSSPDEFEDAIAWREAIDELATENEKLARIMRGKHPTKDKEMGRPKSPGRGRGNGP